MAKITFDNKVDLTVKPIPEINKVTANNINEIKSVVNDLDDEIKLKESTTFEGNIIPLDGVQKVYQTDVSKNFTEYNLSSIKKLGNVAKIWSNAATKPVVNGALLVKGAFWQANKDYDIIVEVEQLDTSGGVRVIYFFVER